MNAPANLHPFPTDTVRHDGWTADRRRTFLECLADGHTAERACAHVGMSKASAYALRRRDPGFALAWSAANLHARDAIADLLTSRAIDGQTETVTRADGSVVTRHRYDNRLALALLARLDRLAAQPETAALGQPDEAAARAAASDFDALLDLVEEDGIAPEVIDSFVEPRIRKLRQLCSAGRVEDLDEEVTEMARPPIRFDYSWDEFVTDLPPPPGFDGQAEGLFGVRGYQRTLTDAEYEALAVAETGLFADKRVEGLRRHAEWFGTLPANQAEPGAADEAPTPESGRPNKRASASVS